MDPTLPVLVSRLADRRALARLVRAALRHEVAHVELAAGPLRAELHKLDLHVFGQPPLSLFAEPAGAPHNGHFPLRLRPIHPSHTPQFFALLAAENMPIDGRPAGHPPPGYVAPGHRIETPGGIPAVPASTGRPADFPDPRKTAPSAFWAAAAQPPRHPSSGSMAIGRHPSGAGPLATTQAMPHPAQAPRAAGAGIDPRRTAPSAVWHQATTVPTAFPAQGIPLAAGASPPGTAAPSEVRAGASEAFAHDASLSVSVVFEPDETLAAIRTADAGASDIAPRHDGASAGEDPADRDEPSLSVSVVFEPGALGNALLHGVPSPLGDATEAHELNGPTTQDEAPPSEEPGSGNTIAQEAPPIPAGFMAAVLGHAPESESAPSTDNESDATLVRAPTPTTPDLDDIPEPAAAERPAFAPTSRNDVTGPAVGRRIAEGKYVIESLIGSGAAGAVYRATHRELRRTVAIKLLHPHYQQDPHFMTSFRDEALAASQLDHPNVMRVLDFGQEADGLVYIVMEYLSGRTLQNLLDEERRLSTERAVEIMTQVCAALSVAHDHGIIHRDIKPDNIMLVPSRNDEGTTFELVKVCDFGIAALQNPRAEDARTTTESMIAGTPEYMSPEQARGAETDARSDVYACGICLYELVTGRPPFLGPNAPEILYQHHTEAPKPPSLIVRGLDPIIEEIILRALQKDPRKRHQSAREMRAELKELIDPGESRQSDEHDDLSIVENIPVLDDPASGFPGFFIAFASAVLRLGRFERGHNEAAQAMRDLSRSLRVALRGRMELTFARRDVGQQAGFVVMTGTAEIVDLRRLLGSQLMGSFGEPFIQALVAKGVASLTLREGLPDGELTYIVELLIGPQQQDELRKELLSKPVRHLSVLFVSDVIGRDRNLLWKVGLCVSRLSRDLRALCNVRGMSLKKMRDTRDDLIAGVARLLTRGDEVKEFLANADLVDEAVANFRGFSSFQVAPVLIERLLHETSAETATLLVREHDETTEPTAEEALRGFLQLFGARLVTERSPRSDAAVAELYRRKLISDGDMPRDLKETIRAESLADALVREPSQFLLTLDLIGDPDAYASELVTLEAAMATLARRSEAVALLAIMSTLSRHAKTGGGMREGAALRTMKAMYDSARFVPIASTLLSGPLHQREAARQLLMLAGSVGVTALYKAREATTDPSARATFVKVLREAGAHGRALIAQTLPQLDPRDDAELAVVEDLLRAVTEHADASLGDTIAKFLAHPVLRPTALGALVSVWGDRAKKPLLDALEYADDATRVTAIGELRRLHAMDDHVFSILERYLTTRGLVSDELRTAAAAAVVDVAVPLRSRAVTLLVKNIEGKRGLFASLRGSTETEENVAVVEAMGRSLLVLDRSEGIRAIKARLSRSDAATRARLSEMLKMG